MRRILKWTVIPIAGIYLLLCLVLYLHQSKFIFVPQRVVEFTPRDFGCAFEDVRFESGGKTLRGWWIPSESVDEQDPQLKASREADDESEPAIEEKEDQAERRSEQGSEDGEQQPADIPESRPVSKPRQLSGVPAMVGRAGIAAALGNRGIPVSVGSPDASAQASAQAGRGVRPALIYLHGNGGSIGANAAHACRLSRIGFGVLIFDYRGYGKSEGGPPTETQVYEDAEQAWQYLLRRPTEMPPGKNVAARTVIYGHSLGGAVAIELAKRHPEAGALIVESTFTSIREMAKQSPMFRYFPTWLILNQHMDSLTKIASVRMPVLLIHGTSDGVVPVAMSEQLYAAAPGRKQILLVPGAGHENCASVAGPKYAQAVAEFMKSGF
jgi:pimeloyl-ACP methyl ester carboxylesterase